MIETAPRPSFTRIVDFKFWEAIQDSPQATNQSPTASCPLHRIVVIKLPLPSQLELPFSKSAKMSYFRITLIRSAIGLPAKSSNVLKALGLHKRMATVFHPVSPSVAGQIMKVKELVAVSEVDKALTKREVHQERVPDPGFYIESRPGEPVKRETP